MKNLFRKLFGTSQAYRFNDLSKAFDGHQLAMYTIPFQTRYSLSMWVIPNGRGGWKIAPRGNPGVLPAAPNRKYGFDFGPLGTFAIIDPMEIKAASIPGARLGVYTLPIISAIAVCWLESAPTPA